MNNKENSEQNKIWTVPFALLITLTVLINMGVSVVIPAMPIILREGFSDAFITWAFLSLLTARFITSNVTGILLQKLPVTTLLVVGFSLHALTMTLFLFAETEDNFLFLRALEGVFEGVVIVCLQYIVASLSNDQNRGRMMGIFSGSFGIGFIVGPLIGSLLIKLGGLSWVFAGTAALMLFGVIASILMIKPLNMNGVVRKPSGGNGPTFTLSFFQYLPFYGGAIIQRGLFVAFGILLPLFLLDNYSLEAYHVGYFFTLSAILTAVFMPITGRFGSSEYKYLIATLSLLVMSVMIFMFSRAANLYWFTGFYVVETLAFCFMVPTTMSIFMEKIANDKNKGLIIGTATSSRDVMAILVITLVTPLYSNNPNVPWILLSLLTFLVVLPYLLSAMGPLRNNNEIHQDA